MSTKEDIVSVGPSQPEMIGLPTGTGLCQPGVRRDCSGVKGIGFRLDSRESSVDTNTTLQAQTNSSSITSVSQAVARLFPSVGSNVTRTATSVPRSAKSRKRQNDSHCRRESGFFLKDVMLLPSPRITKIPRGKLRENLHLEGYAASAVEFGYE